MALLKEDAMEVALKLVYCGMPEAGKSTNLCSVHSQLPENERGDLIEVSNSSDRIQSFDFRPSNGMDLHGYSSSFQLYTVPGPVTFNATRQLVLREVDAVILVIDSVKDHLEGNRQTIKQLSANLIDNGIEPRSIPVVAQFNKRDLPDVIPLDCLNDSFQEYLGGLPCSIFEAAAQTGVGVFETLNAAAIEAVNRFKPPTIASRRTASRGKVALAS